MAQKKQEKRQAEKARIYITATYNNTLVTITDDNGTPIVTGSCGMYGFSGTRKSTPYAATVTVQSTVQKALDNNGVRDVAVYIKGIGPGRNASLKAIKALGLNVYKILDVTPVPHNGVRPPKQKKG